MLTKYNLPSDITFGRLLSQTCTGLELDSKCQQNHNYITYPKIYAGANRKNEN